ncbi:hypothetical protein E2P81_ATG07713 [Venturia nashicola]|nr:hypothetical protein E2P81_ATG07713 [Venturia nashicola]
MAPKRKRANTTSKAPEVSLPASEVQPSSRDASGEDTEDAVLQEVIAAKQDQDVPSSKRSRSNCSEAEKGDNDADMEERLEHGEGGEAGTMKMDAPPKAGLVDPVGYKTNPPPVGRPVRIYADGVFDLFHLGHMRQLQQAKTAFPDVYLLVGVTGDYETHKRKGLTVLSGKERAESVRHCKWVDEVIEDCPWIIADAPEFMEKHQIDYIAHDDIPYGADEGDDIYKGIKEAGKFLVTQRTEGVSTTGIITKIVRDYDKYISRQLKRGTTRQELNVSWLKKGELEFKRTVTDLRDSIRQNWSTTGQELGRDIRQILQPSRPQSPAPSRSREPSTDHGALRSPSALSHLAHLDVPTSSPATNGSGSGGQRQDFATGYALGLVGGVRNWMTKSRRNLNDSRHDSDSEENDLGSPTGSMKSGHTIEEPKRGRQGQAKAKAEASS